MMKYQKPEMEVTHFEKVETVTDSNTLYVPGDGSNTGGNEGSTGWDKLNF